MLLFIVSFLEQHHPCIFFHLSGVCVMLSVNIYGLFCCMYIITNNPLYFMNLNICVHLCSIDVSIYIVPLCMNINISLPYLIWLVEY